MLRVCNVHITNQVQTTFDRVGGGWGGGGGSKNLLEEVTVNSKDSKEENS